MKWSIYSERQKKTKILEQNLQTNHFLYVSAVLGASIINKSSSYILEMHPCFLLAYEGIENWPGVMMAE